MAARELSDADVSIVTSYCPDGLAATAIVLQEAGGMRVFYDLDTPVTLSELKRAGSTSYIGPEGLAGFDLVLSYTGGQALDELRDTLGARRAEPLYGHVDPRQYGLVGADPAFTGDLSYLGTYAADRQPGVERFLVEPARRNPSERFVIGGAQYPADFPWTGNIHFVRHLPPCQHPAFYASSRLTLNVTRSAMAEMGWCPSGRLFEAAACGAAIVTDTWSGLDDFFTPGEEVLPVDTTDGVMAALAKSNAELERIRRRARERVLAQHTSMHRARQLEAILGATPAPQPAGMTVGEDA